VIDDPPEMVDVAVKAVALRRRVSTATIPQKVGYHDVEVSGSFSSKIPANASPESPSP